MSSSQNEQHCRQQFSKRRNITCVATSVFLLAVVAGASAFLTTRHSGEQNNVESLSISNQAITSSSSSPTPMLRSQAPSTAPTYPDNDGNIDIEASSKPNSEAPSLNSTAFLELDGLVDGASQIERLSQVPSTYPTSSNEGATSRMELLSQVPSTYPTTKVAVKTQIGPFSQVPSTHPTSSNEVPKSNDVGDYNDIDISRFQGPITDFLVASEWARVQTFQNNGCCESGEGRWRLVLETDAYPWETSWALMKGGEKIANGPPPQANYARLTRYIGSMCLEAGEYTMQMKDQAGDGICCKWGQGKFSVSIDGKSVADSDDSDFDDKHYSFNITQPSRESEHEPCFAANTYDAIDNDIAILKNSILNDKARSHFLGGIVRLTAHDFMDFHPHKNSQMGPDGCFDVDHPVNSGLGSIWCSTCKLTLLYEEKYSHISRADFWVAAANAVIRETSVGNGLDLKNTFLWGRKDAASCRGSGDRLPTADGCDETEEIFLRRMGLEWKDAVALMGAHTLGRGDFSGHHGTWSVSDKEAQVFDKKYYDELFNSVWWPINMGQPTQDWVTGRGLGNSLMLNTDICLVYDMEELLDDGTPCCTKINGECIEPESAKTKCPMYSRMHSRWEAREAVQEMLGGSNPNDPNLPFYTAFAKAWAKATTVGQEDLFPLAESCDSLFM